MVLKQGERFEMWAELFLVGLILLPLAVWSTTRTVPKDSYALKAQKNLLRGKEFNPVMWRVL